jgi:hypothetical protein
MKNPDADFKRSAESALNDLYVAVSKAQVLGFFKGPHGPLEETAWIHVGIHELEEIEGLANQALDGDPRAAALMRKLLMPAPTWRHIAPAEHSAGEARFIVQPRRPHLVGTAALLLDGIETGTYRRWLNRAIGFYSVRSLSVNRALEAAKAVAARRLSLAEFAREVQEANFLGTPMRHRSVTTERMSRAHATGSAMRDHRPTEFAPDMSNPLARELTATFHPLIELTAQHDPASVPVTLRRLSESGYLHVEDSIRLNRLAGRWTELGDNWRDTLSRRGTPEVAQEDRKAPLRNRCVPDQPQHGGRWDIATFAATETDEFCPPAQALQDASSKVYGRAGAELIKAQNEWIEAKGCYGKAGEQSRKCIKEEDHGYKKCAEERDDGYDRCAREEDHGYRDCCDWIPCKWACDAWTWIKNLVCVAWEWVSNIVCVFYTWVKKMACVAWAYVEPTLCALGHVALAGAHAAAGIGGIFLGAATRTIGSFVSGFCKMFGVKPSTRTINSLKVVGIHVAVLHTNKVLLFAYDEGVHPVSENNPADFTAIGDSDRALCALWNPATATAKYVTLKRNLFCSHTAFTENGDLFVAGGQFPLPGLLKSFFPPTLLAPGADKDVHIFNTATESWERLPDMENGRWYPTCVTLPDGRIMIASGTNGWATEGGLGRGIQSTYQIGDPRTKTMTSPTAIGINQPDEEGRQRAHLFHLYPFMHLLPSGKVFVHFKRTTLLYNPATMLLERVAVSGTNGAKADETGRTNDPYSRTGPGPGTCVQLPLIPRRNPGTGTSDYPAGRIMILGGGGAEKKPEEPDKTDGQGDPNNIYKLHSNTKATNSSEILDFSEAMPEWQFTNEWMRNGRVMPDSILLPTGKVLVVGGGRTGQSGGLLAHFTSTETGGQPDKGATDPVLEPEVFDPETHQWEQWCPKKLARLYHTTAVLLPDARVLVAGHDGALNMMPFDESRYELELFSPPYLFNDNGQLAQRPVIAGAPAELPFGERFQIDTPNAADIASVALIRQSSVTHQINSDQRYVGLAILDASSEHLMVQAPPNRNIAPPGYYMLFIVNRFGVPSVAHWIRAAALR